MALFLNKCPIAICDRCQQKAGWDELVPDGNSPGLRVHRDKSCYDGKNPWRLPPIKPDRIALKWSRPDTPLDAGISYVDITNPINPIPPANTFIPLEGLEGTGSVGLEGGGSVEFES